MEQAGAFLGAMLNGYRQARVLMVAHRIGVFEAIGDGRRSGTWLAQRLECDEETLQQLLLALVSMGLLEMADGAFSNSPVCQSRMLKKSHSYVGDVISLHDFFWDCWGDLEEVVRSGKPSTSLVDAFANRGGLAQSYARAVGILSQGAVQAVAKLTQDITMNRLLDVGGGTGAYARALLVRRPQLQAAVLELGDTLDARDKTKDDHPRLEFVAGDYLAEDFPSGYDTILFSNILHDESPQACAELCARAYRALPAGGTLLIHDWRISPDRTQPLAAALFSLNQSTYTHGGRLYTPLELEAFAREAGFPLVMSESVEAPGTPYDSMLVQAQRGEAA